MLASDVLKSFFTATDKIVKGDEEKPKPSVIEGHPSQVKEPDNRVRFEFFSGHEGTMVALLRILA